MVAKGIHEVAAGLRSAGRHLTIETAATLPPEGIACDLASLSPKLANSRPDQRFSAAWRERHDRDRLRPEVIRAWMEHADHQLKFVVTDPGDIAEIDALLAAIGPVEAKNVMLMPEGTRADLLHDRGVWLARLCAERGFRFCPRLHIELFGNTRGT